MDGATVATGTKNAEMYLGLLHSVENLRVYGPARRTSFAMTATKTHTRMTTCGPWPRLRRYGYLTNTKIKFIVVLTAAEGQVKDSDMRAVRAPACDPWPTLSALSTCVPPRSFTSSSASLRVQPVAGAPYPSLPGFRRSTAPSHQFCLPCPPCVALPVLAFSSFNGSIKSTCT